MPVATDAQIRANMKTLLQAGSGINTRVVTRWKLGVDPEEWAAVARSLNDPTIINGWILTRTKSENRKREQVVWEYEYHYTLWYFRSVREGTEQDNSEKDVNAVIEACVTQFENSPTLGFDIGGGDGIHGHSELQIEDIDIIKDQMHLVQCSLIVYLTKQP